MSGSQKELVPDSYKLMFSEEQIRQRMVALGAEIARDFKGEKPILIGVLNGGFIFLADLIRHINIDLEIDFVRISSYGDARESSGHIKILKPLSADIKGRSVLVVDDIVDSGLSVQFLNNMLTAFKPDSLKFATLLFKPNRLQVKIDLHYIGFEIEDTYVVGYGLDDAQVKRNLRGIYTIQ